MNSLDPWRLIVTNPAGNVLVPRPFYGHSLYNMVPSWPNVYGSPRRLLFDGAFIGADASVLGPDSPDASKRTGLTAVVAPVVAPATGGISVRHELDDKQILHVEINVDGKSYSTSMDLAPAIAAVLSKLAQWHESQHAAKTSEVTPAAVVGCVNSAVGCAVNEIVGQLVQRHVGTVCGSFLGDIVNAVQGAVKTVAHTTSSLAGGLIGGIGSTLKKLKGPIAAAASIAAVAAASAIPGVGPIAAPIAGKLANALVAAAAGDSAATKAVAQAQQQAETNPTVAVALDAATKAVANATVAHHVQDTAKKAARGDNASQQQIVKIADDAEKGDPAAKAVADLVANAMNSEWGAKIWEGVTGRGPDTASSGWYDIVGGAWYDVVGAISQVEQIQNYATSLAAAQRGVAIGVIHTTADDRWKVYAFGSLDDAIDWLQRATYNKASFTYAAAYDKDNEGRAFTQGEVFGSTPQPAAPSTDVIRRGIATTSGWR